VVISELVGLTTEPRCWLIGVDPGRPGVWAGLSVGAILGILGVLLWDALESVISQKRMNSQITTSWWVRFCERHLVTTIE
jgi:hypothetical protein